MKTCVINQPAGIGDILFCMKIAKTIITRLGYNVIWPVIPQYTWLSEYISIPEIEFININEDFIFKDLFNIKSKGNRTLDDNLYIPLDGASNRLKTNMIMNAKYESVDLDFHNWQAAVNIKRNKTKEDNLFYKELQLTDNEEYILVNNSFASPPHCQINNIPINDSRRIVNMDIIEQYTLFDWIKVLENASRIDIIDSSTTLLLDILDLSANDVNIYSRVNKPAEPSFTQTRHLLNKSSEWNWKQL